MIYLGENMSEIEKILRAIEKHVLDDPDRVPTPEDIHLVEGYEVQRNEYVELSIFAPLDFIPRYLLLWGRGI